MRPITAADLMNPDVLTVREDLPVRELARFLVDNDITGAPVQAADGHLVGVVSVVDIAGVASEAAEAAAEAAEEAAEQDSAAADATDDGREDGEDDDELGDRSAYFAGSRAEEALAEGELAELGLEDEDLLVEDIMTPHVFSVSADATVSDVASLMLKEHLHRVLVVDGGRPVGIISTSDLLGLLVDEP